MLRRELIRPRRRSDSRFAINSSPDIPLDSSASHLSHLRLVSGVRFPSQAPCSPARREIPTSRAELPGRRNFGVLGLAAGGGTKRTAKVVGYPLTQSAHQR